MFGFRRKPDVRDLRDGSWGPGDLAVCIRDDWTIPAAFHPSAGDLLRVHNVYTDVVDRAKVTALTFEGLAPRAGYPSLAFRKPIRDDRSADEEFTDLLRQRATVPSSIEEVVGSPNFRA